MSKCHPWSGFQYLIKTLLLKSFDIWNIFFKDDFKWRIYLNKSTDTNTVSIIKYQLLTVFYFKRLVHIHFFADLPIVNDKSWWEKAIKERSFLKYDLKSRTILFYFLIWIVQGMMYCPLKWHYIIDMRW